jgi:hypothetical protein
MILYDPFLPFLTCCFAVIQEVTGLKLMMLGSNKNGEVMVEGTEL